MVPQDDHAKVDKAMVALAGNIAAPLGWKAAWRNNMAWRGLSKPRVLVDHSLEHGDDYYERPKICFTGTGRSGQASVSRSISASSRPALFPEAECCCRGRRSQQLLPHHSASWIWLRQFCAFQKIPYELLVKRGIPAQHLNSGCAGNQGFPVDGALTRLPGIECGEVRVGCRANCAKCDHHCSSHRAIGSLAAERRFKIDFRIVELRIHDLTHFA